MAFTSPSLYATRERSSGPSHHPGSCCPAGSSGTTTASDALPARHPLPGSAPVIGRDAPTAKFRRPPGRGGPVPVGTALADGPPVRSQRALLTHWAPALGTSVEALLGEGVRDVGGRERSCRDAVHALERETSAPVLRANVREAKEVERLRLAEAARLPSLGGEPSELDQARLLGRQLQTELRDPVA